VGYDVEPFPKALFVEQDEDVGRAQGGNSPRILGEGCRGQDESGGQGGPFVGRVAEESLERPEVAAVGGEDLGDNQKIARLPAGGEPFP
jgi:hypothetical protein